MNLLTKATNYYFGNIQGKINIPESRRFSVEKRLWCDQFTNLYHSCDLLDFKANFSCENLKQFCLIVFYTLRSPQCGEGECSGECDEVLHKSYLEMSDRDEMSSTFT